MSTRRPMIWSHENEQNQKLHLECHGKIKEAQGLYPKDNIDRQFMKKEQQTNSIEGFEDYIKKAKKYWL